MHEHGGEDHEMEKAVVEMQEKVKEDHKLLNMSTLKRASVMARPETSLALSCHNLRYTVAVKPKKGDQTPQVAQEDEWVARLC